MKLKIFLSVLIILSFISLVSAWDFYGYTYDTDGNALNNTVVNITFYTISSDAPPTLVGSNSSTSNESGWFNFSVTSNSSWFYKPVINHFNSTTNAIDYIGQSLPQFPYSHFVNTTNINFYLKEAGTINITAINSTSDRINFTYAVKDTKLGFPIASEYITSVSEAVVYVPRDRNYSVMIFPEMALPISFDWNNFSADSSYDIVTGLSTYNVTTHTVQKTFNATDNLIRLTGYINATSISGWDEFTVVPFLLEPGDMIYIGGSNMPHNMSAWNGQSDNYNLTSGFYNITLPGPAESATYILFATARNETGYYGGYKNITLGYSSSGTESNFTMHPLMSTDWAFVNSNISLDNPTGPGSVNISSAKQIFTLVNSTNGSITQSNAFIELKVDYSGYGAKEFTFVTQISSGSSSFYAPLLNFSVKEMNIYSQSYAPKRVGTRTASQILSNSNITLNTFNPGSIDEGLAGSSIFIKLHKSNSTCDLPSAGDSCNAVSGSQTRDDFNPLSAVMGGGKLNFRMGYSGIEIVYINVDMIASGPPDVSFDDEEYAGTTSGSFETAFRFGSSGPTIYDYVLISMPYTEGSTAVTGLNENADVNMSIPILYDENWNVIWNASANGTTGSALAGNNTHYSTYSSQWETLMGQNNCTRNESELNATNPCYIDTTNNKIWIRLPHFSGTQPSVTGSVITATPASETPASSSSGGGSATTSEWAKQKVHSWVKMTPGVATIMKDFDNAIGIKQIQVEVKNEAQNVKITVRKYDSKPANVSVEKSGKIHKYLQIETQNLEENLEKAIINIQVNKSWVSDNNLDKDNIALFKFDEDTKKWNELSTNYFESDDNYYYYDVELTSFSYFAIGEKTIEDETSTESELISETEGEDEEKIRSLLWLWILIILVIAGVVGFIIYQKKKE